MRRRPPCREFGGDTRAELLSERIAARGRQVSALLHTLLADVAEFDRAGAWRGAGAVSMEAWVGERCGVSGGTARMWVRAASRLQSLPRLADALATGSLSLEQVSPLVDVATPDTDGELAEAAQDWSVKQARELARWCRGVSDAAAARRFEQRSLRYNDARRSMSLSFTDDDYAEVKSSLMRQVRLNERARKDGVTADPAGYVPYHQQLYDVALQMFRSSGGGAGGGGAGGGGAGGGGAGGGSRAARFRPTLVVHAPLELLLAGVAGEGGAGAEGAPGGGAFGLDVLGGPEIQGVGPVAMHVVRRLACDARITLSAEGRDGRILDQGRLRRDPTEAQRIEIARRDKGCRFPSCDFVDFTEVHHVVHWADGGRTDIDNLITLCGRHHNAVHELGWEMRGDANGLVTFTSPHGQVMRSKPSPAWRVSVPLRR